MTAYCFNYDRIKLLLSRKSCICGLKILAQSYKLLGAEKFRRFAIRSLDIALAYLRLAPKSRGQSDCYLRFAVDLFLAAGFLPNSATEIHYLSILGRSSFHSLSKSFKQWLMKSNRPTADITLLLDQLLGVTDDGCMSWLVRWAIHNNPRGLRRAIDNFVFPTGTHWEVAAEQISHERLYVSQCIAYAYLGYFFGCSVFRVKYGPAWFVTRLRLNCIKLLESEAHIDEEERYILERFIVLGSAFLANPTLGDLCLFNAPYFDLRILTRVLKDPKFVIHGTIFDLRAKQWPSLFDLTYRFTLNIPDSIPNDVRVA